MRRAFVLVSLMAFVGVSSSMPHAEVQQAARLEKDYPVQPVPFTAVHLNDAFWAPRIETNRTATIPVGVRAVRGDGARRQLHPRRRRRCAASRSPT